MAQRLPWDCWRHERFVFPHSSRHFRRADASLYYASLPFLAVAVVPYELGNRVFTQPCCDTYGRRLFVMVNAKFLTVRRTCRSSLCYHGRLRCEHLQGPGELRYWVSLWAAAHLAAFGNGYMRQHRCEIAQNGCRSAR